MLDTDELVAQAVATAGTDDFGGDSWREGLDRLLDSLRHEARLSELGEQVVAGEVVGYLTSRAGVVAWRRDHPDVAKAEIRPPIVIIGQARTGTTILYDLLAQDPASRTPLTWEVDRPLPPPDSATYDSDPRIAEVESVLEMTDLLIPGFRAFHPLGARLAQECVRITAAEFRSMIFATQYHVPAYTRWLLDEADMAPAYDWHHRFLQHLQTGHPGDRWVLKSPAHLWSLDALLAAYPDALLVQTHRDPLRVIASVSALVAQLRRIACEDPTVVEAAREYAGYILDGFDRSVDARETGAVPRERVVDVHFGEFMADPFATIGAVYARLGLELTVDAEQRMRAFLDEHPSEVGGGRYTFADTGLDER